MDSIKNIVQRLRESRLSEAKADYDNMERNDLIKLAQEGDQYAVEVLINNHKDFLGKMSNKYIMGGQDKEDVEQLANIAFWNAIEEYNPESSGDFEAFAGMIIKRKLTDALRKDTAKKREIHNTAASLDEPVADDGEGGESTLGDTLASKSGSAEEQYISKSSVNDIMKFMEENLSDSEREVIRLYIKGYKMSQIAEETGMKYKSAENALMRVKNKLNDYLRARESKKINETTIEFSEEEKQILSRALSKMESKSRIKESVRTSLYDYYENCTEDMLDKELESMREELGEIQHELARAPWESSKREDLTDRLEDISSKLSVIEEFITEDQHELFNELEYKAWKIKDEPYDSSTEDDPRYEPEWKYDR